MVYNKVTITTRNLVWYQISAAIQIKVTTKTPDHPVKKLKNGDRMGLFNPSNNGQRHIGVKFNYPI